MVLRVPWVVYARLCVWQRRTAAAAAPCRMHRARDAVQQREGPRRATHVRAAIVWIIRELRVGLGAAAAAARRWRQRLGRVRMRMYVPGAARQTLLIVW
eukprot:366488-Chlamydomonas_euryale.AAC.3